MIVDNQANNSLELTLSADQSDVDESEINCFLQINNQTESLTIRNATKWFLKQISEYFTNLTSLKIELLRENYLNYQGDTIHFNTVNNVIINTTRENEIPEGIAFDNVLNMTMIIGPQTNNNWIEFIGKQNENLCIFTLYKSDITQEDFKKLSEKMTNIEEFEMIDSSPIARLTFDDLNGFIADKKNLAMMFAGVIIKMDD